MHEDMAWYMVLMEDGVCCLDDHPAHGSPFHVMDGDLYGLLEGAVSIECV